MDSFNCKDVVFLSTGYIRKYCSKQHVIKDLIINIATYYGGRYNDEIYVQLESSEELINDKGYYLISRKAASLSNLYKSITESNNGESVIQVKKVRKDILEFVCQYLGHHNGIKPEEIAKPIRSVRMERICADKWDAIFMNSLTKKTTFQVILAANYMDIPSLLHLGCAKIATLIKGKSPEEIKTILADDDDTNDQQQDTDNNEQQKEQDTNVATTKQE